MENERWISVDVKGTKLVVITNKKNMKQKKLIFRLSILGL